MNLPATRRRSAAAALGLALTGGLLVAAGPAAEAGTSAPSNPAAIIVNQASTTAPTQSVTPYPSTLTQWGIDGPITDINVDLDNLTFGVPSDIEILLVSPKGTAVQLYSDSCLGSYNVSRSYWTIDDEAPTNFPVTATDPLSCGSGSYRPTDWSIGGVPEFPSPAPAGPYSRTLSTFDGENPNGTWRLYVADDTNRPGNGSDHGVILNGFRLIITTQSRSILIPAGADGAGPASPFPVEQTVTGQNGRIRDVFVYLRNLSHSRPDDLDVLLVAPTGQTVLLMSDACGGLPVPNGTSFRFNDNDPAMPEVGICNTGSGGGVNYRPTDHAPADSLPAPAPPGPYATSLSVLDGLSPNGTWRLYIHDDLTGHSGYMDSFLVSFDLGPAGADTVAPNTSITGHPKAKTTARRAQFTFNATEVGATFACRLDKRAWTSCTSPRTHTKLAVGKHVFRVRASDAAGNQDTTPATWNWRIRR